MYIYFSAQQITGFIHGRRAAVADQRGAHHPLLFLFLYHCGEQQTAQITGGLITFQVEGTLMVSNTGVG